MHKKIGIVTMSLDKWELKEISREIKKKGYETEVVNDKNFVIDFQHVRSREKKYHSVLGRVERPILQQGLTILKAMELSGERIYNNSEAIYNGQNKAYCSAFLSYAGVSHPKTIFSFSGKDITNELEKMTFPVVIKPWIGGRGVGIVKADNPSIAKDFIELLEHNNQPIYIQEFVNNPKSEKIRDMRVFVVGDEPIGVFYREATLNNWKTNICNGGIAHKCKLDPIVGEMAVKAIQAINADIAGVDIIESEDGYHVLEVNVCPLFRGFFDTTGINPAESIAKILCSQEQ